MCPKCGIFQPWDRLAMPTPDLLTDRCPVSAQYLTQLCQVLGLSMETTVHSIYTIVTVTPFLGIDLLGVLTSVDTGCHSAARVWFKLA